MAYQFTTLRHPVEKLLEAEHFLKRLTVAQGIEFQFELNAFLSASRSVTFVLQKAMSHGRSFDTWYAQRQAEMSADPAMRFFLQLRNISQKQGPVSYVGTMLSRRNWAYYFVGISCEVPAELAGKDIRDCCVRHLVKLAKVLLACVEDLPYHCCPARALTEEGMTALGYDWKDVEEAVGLPPGWSAVADIPARDRLRILRREFDALDVASIRRIVTAPVTDPVAEMGSSNIPDDLVHKVAASFGAGRDARDLRTVIVNTFLSKMREGRET